MTKQVYGYVYMTTNQVNGKKYIGQKASSSFVENYKGSGTYLKNAINKYGEENFKTEVLEWCYSQEELDEKERFYIQKNNAIESDEFYNLASGGSFGNARKGSKFSKQARQKMSEINQGEKNAMWGKTHSEESRKKISDHHADFKGEKSPSYNRVCINDGNKVRYIKKEDLETFISDGWKIGTTEEQKQMLSKTQKGRKHTEETKRKMSFSQRGEKNGMYGKHHSKKTRQKMSTSRYGRKWINNGTENKFVNSEEFKYYINQGWRIGRFISLEQTEHRKIALTGRTCVNNGIINKYVTPEQLKDYLSNGYVLGKIKKAVS